MRSATKLDGIIGVWRSAHREHSNLVAIFLAEQRHGARGDRFVGSHQARSDCLVAANLRIHVSFHLLDFLPGQRFRVREIEPEVVRSDQASLLGDMGAETMPKRGMEQVRSAMVGPDAVAAFGIYRLVDRFPD